MAFASGKRNLKIAVLVRNFVTCGGMERYAVEIARRLRERGHEIHLFCREKDERLVAGMIVHRVPLRWEFSSALGSLGFARDCAGLLKGETYDIIHSHERGYSQDVLTVHTFSYKGSLCRYPLLRRFDQTWLSDRGWVYLWLEARQMQTRRLVAVSENIREDIRKHYHRLSGVDIIEPGVDADLFNPDRIPAERDSLRTKFSVADTETVVLFVGSEFKRKGLDRLIPAIGPGMRLLVVGRGENLPFYQNLAVQHGVVWQVDFVGLVEDDVGRYYAAADVVVLP
ncbi:MAG: glycosyltransferase family 4 protein, partial [Deltaproteobacteria bacterium]|nr:glycosyltransferase family 4 protein [Deltaproteobacteria bacterium]